MNIDEVIEGIDWEQLRAQKQALAAYQGEDWAEGLLSLIDHIQDAADLEGYPVYVS